MNSSKVGKTISFLRKHYNMTQHELTDNWSYWTKEAIQPLIDLGIKGVDRVVQIGKTMDFDLICDGYNLVERLTRTVEIR